jgi:hypothetical protein
MLDRLLNHPEFQQGVNIAQNCFLDHHEATPLTEDEMINEIEESLESAGNGTSYFFHLGFAFGTINQGLSAGSGD